MTKKERSFLLFILLIFLIFQIFPYLYGFIIQGPDKVFSGFIMRWNDNNTYLAKMEQGFNGNWMFTFDYALEPHDSAFIYPLYLGLGHLIRIFHLDYLFTFHFLRILAGILMFFSLYRYISTSFKNTPTRTKQIMLFAVLTGTGLSWSSLYFIDDFTSMLEAFPHNASFANIHFPLTLACIFFIFTPFKEGTLKWHHYLTYFLLSAVCGFISSFAVVVLITILALIVLFRWINHLPLKQHFWTLIFVGNGGGWIILYQLWIMHTKPDFILWASQNIIGKISFANFSLSFFPYVIIVIFAIIYFFKKFATFAPEKYSLYAWAIAIPLMLLIPSVISTRFLIGGFTPFVLVSFDYILSEQFKWEALFLKISSLTSIALITLELGILLLIVQNQRSMDFASTFIPQDVYQAYQWIDTNLPERSYILTEHYNGNYFPRFTNAIPTLGHWCETPHAYDQDQLVRAYFSGDTSLTQLKTLGVQYIFYGPGEQELGNTFSTTNLNIIYQNDTVTLYQILY